MSSTRKRPVCTDGELTLSKRPKTRKPQPVDDVELISPSRSGEEPLATRRGDGTAQEKGNFRPPEKDRVEIAEQEAVTGDVDGYLDGPNEPFPGLPYDVCFGKLLMEASCQNKTWEPAPEGKALVKITHHGSWLMLRYEESGSHAGLVISPALTQLASEHLVTLVASVGPPARRGTSSMGSSVRSRPLQVLVYGRLTERNAVAEILDEGGLFLQRPHDSEYDRRVKYFNPMYLLPPGEDMPRTGISSVFSGRGLATATADEEMLEEAERCRVLRIFDEASGLDAGVVSEVKQSPRIISKLKSHQLEALAMMLEKEQQPADCRPKFPLLWEHSVEEEGTVYRHIVTKAPQAMPLPSLRGGILADEMGLGKTLSSLALICHHFDAATRVPSSQMSRATLIVCPMSTIYGWQMQIERHIRPGDISTLLYHGAEKQSAPEQLHSFDVVLTTYDTLRSDWNVNGPLYARPWARVILDEAHRIRNRKSKIFAAACEIRAMNRWCLTGTPIQNSLGDYGSLLAFVGVPPFTTYDQFRFWISTPILSNRSHNLHTLRKLVRATCLRRTKAHPALASALRLPRKRERVEAVVLAEDERELYDFFKRRSYLLAGEAAPAEAKPGASPPPATKPRRRREKPSGGKASRKPTANIMVLLFVLRIICDHGEALLPPAALGAWRSHDAARIGWSLLETAAGAGQSCCVCGIAVGGEELEKGGRDVVDLACRRHIACESCVGLGTDNAQPACPTCGMAGVDGVLSSSPSRTPAAEYRPSSKVSAMLRNVVSTLRGGLSVDIEDRPAKSVIFSHWTSMLDLISTALGPDLSSRGLSLVRIDGRSSLQQRREAMEKFNLDHSCVVMLATIGAVGEGIDLSIASEVHLMEPHWNPMAEAQAVDRVHRIGQTKEVAIIRYCVKDSIEEYIRWVQQSKIQLISATFSTPEQAGEKTTEEALAVKRWNKLLEFLK
ncbi:hypothetical protein KVR01_006200 [Diaporthe batatas]|uniref:uncharacterized protein n=1 Tax=Diaporthe batatas TaxID=748121 RepID=UPI001D037D82|nr:uncharacterized protein KVR01_006200 [Diaporthe batatas]KAG8164282.1 hypothetical protein KVR01_006200 [Diaporthe batatas]